MVTKDHPCNGRERGPTARGIDSDNGGFEMWVRQQFSNRRRQSKESPTTIWDHLPEP
jgi:hypothetical protein